MTVESSGVANRQGVDISVVKCRDMKAYCPLARMARGQLLIEASTMASAAPLAIYEQVLADEVDEVIQSQTSRVPTDAGSRRRG